MSWPFVSFASWIVVRRALSQWLAPSTYVDLDISLLLRQLELPEEPQSIRLILRVVLLDQANRRKEKLSLSGRVSTDSQRSLAKVYSGSSGVLLQLLSPTTAPRISRRQ